MVRISRKRQTAEVNLGKVRQTKVRLEAHSRGVERGGSLGQKGLSGLEESTARQQTVIRKYLRFRELMF